MRLILFLLIGILTSCSRDNIKSDSEKEGFAAQNTQNLIDESKFIHDNFFRNAMLQPCLSQQTFLTKTVHGSWHRLENCNLILNGIDINEKDISIHKDKNGKVNGLRFFIYPETKYGKYLRENYSINTVSNESKICIQYYNNTLPIVTITDESLCDAIHYESI